MGVLDQTFDRVCIDTDIIVDYAKKRQPGNKVFIEAQSRFHCYTTSISLYEFYYGVEYTGSERSRRQADRIFGYLDILSFDEDAAKTAAKIDIALSKGGWQIGVKDMLTAAICLAKGVPLLTKNIDHFTRVSGLLVLSPDMF